MIISQCSGPKFVVILLQLRHLTLPDRTVSYQMGTMGETISLWIFVKDNYLRYPNGKNFDSYTGHYFR